MRPLTVPMGMGVVDGVGRAAAGGVGAAGIDVWIAGRAVAAAAVGAGAQDMTKLSKSEVSAMKW